jgi:hypothetical protein
MNVRELVEATFVQLQSDALHDPFNFTIDYYGFDFFGGVSSYLGYFVVSIGKYASDANNFWDLYVNGKPAGVGIDSYAVQAGDNVELKWMPTAKMNKEMAARMERVRARRGA